jgi:hypothetical protein
VTGVLRSLIAVGAAGVVLGFALVSLAEAIRPRRGGRVRPASPPSTVDGVAGRGVLPPDGSEVTMVLPGAYVRRRQSTKTNGAARE